MKTTKFRAWDSYQNKMYEWDEICKMDSDESLTLTNLLNGFIDHIKPLQFTGLKDKNGVEIYFGDILRFPAKDKWEEINYSCFEVFFHNGDANSDYNIGYSINRMHNHGSIAGGHIPSFKPKVVSNMIIIGNRFENPELL